MKFPLSSKERQIQAQITGDGGTLAHAQLSSSTLGWQTLWGRVSQRAVMPKSRITFSGNSCFSGVIIETLAEKTKKKLEKQVMCRVQYCAAFLLSTSAIEQILFLSMISMRLWLQLPAVHLFYICRQVVMPFTLPLLRLHQCFYVEYWLSECH